MTVTSSGKVCFWSPKKASRGSLWKELPDLINSRGISTRWAIHRDVLEIPKIDPTNSAQILSAVGRSQVLQGNTSMAHIRSDTLQKKIRASVEDFFTYTSPTLQQLVYCLPVCSYVNFPYFRWPTLSLGVTSEIHMYLGKSLLNLHLEFQLVLTKFDQIMWNHVKTCGIMWNNVKSCEKSGEISCEISHSSWWLHRQLALPAFEVPDPFSTPCWPSRAPQAARRAGRWSVARREHLGIRWCNGISPEMIGKSHPDPKYYPNFSVKNIWKSHFLYENPK